MVNKNRETFSAQETFAHAAAQASYAEALPSVDADRLPPPAALIFGTEARTITLGAPFAAVWFRDGDGGRIPNLAGIGYSWAQAHADLLFSVKQLPDGPFRQRALTVLREQKSRVPNGRPQAEMKGDPS